MWVARKQVVFQSCLESNFQKCLFFYPQQCSLQTESQNVSEVSLCAAFRLKSCLFPTVGRMWDPGGRGLALGDPGKLCHAVVLPSLPVGSQPAHRSGNHHHGDWLSWMRGSCQRESSSASYGKKQWLLSLWPRNVIEYQLIFTSSPTKTTKRMLFSSTFPIEIKYRI